MTQTTVKLQIPFASLVEAIASLELEKKLQLVNAKPPEYRIGNSQNLYP
jgi:hypothetical protein